MNTVLLKQVVIGSLQIEWVLQIGLWWKICELNISSYHKNWTPHLYTHKKVPSSFTRNKQILKTALKVVLSGHLKLGFIWAKLKTPWHFCSDIFRWEECFPLHKGPHQWEKGLAWLNSWGWGYMDLKRSFHPSLSILTVDLTTQRRWFLLCIDCALAPTCELSKAMLNRRFPGSTVV